MRAIKSYFINLAAITAILIVSLVLNPEYEIIPIMMAIALGLLISDLVIQGKL